MPSVGKSLPHESAVGHVTGAAPFIEDLPRVHNELLVSFVGSPVAHGRLKSIDLTEARRVPGIVGLYTVKDVDGKNTFGPVIEDEQFLVEDECRFIGEPIVVIAGESEQAIERAKQRVKLKIEPLEPVFRIDDAIRNQQFIGPKRKIERGDIEAALAKAEHVLEGTFVSGGQEQFYLESQAAIAYPREQDQILVHSSTQGPTEVQKVVAEVLGLGYHQVVCMCQRMGGGFGGKETQGVVPAVMVALVAHKTGRAARIIYDKDTDMKVTGKRHAYQSRYKVGFDGEGRITALRLDYFSNGGAGADLSTSILERSMLHAENAYYIRNIQINGRICRTNLPPNTAFRGFGGPQAVAVMENIIEEVAIHLGKDSYDLRRLNCYGDPPRNVTPYGQVIEHHLLREIFERLAQSGDYKNRLEAVKRFNAASKTHLKGISMTPVKFGISFTAKFLNQANALVNVYTDGTVQVSHGGTEMGQGVHTKIRQLVADEFAISPDHVMVMTTSTEKSNNTSPSAASATTDLNGTAAVLACQKIRQRLARCAAEHFASAERGIERSPKHIVFEDGTVYDSRCPDCKLTFREMVVLAYRNRVSLGERGFYATPGVDFNRETGKGSPFLYYTTGCALAEVLIDRFTGDLVVPRVDLLMDIGKPINPGVEMGQVIGGFIQGMGWVTAEELRYSDEGELLSYSPTTYKIPNVQDVPVVFNADLIPNDANVRNLRASKATGEPPLLLAVAVWTAVKHALSFVAAGAVPYLELPATNEEILRRITQYTGAKSAAAAKPAATDRPAKVVS
ncbi:MAG: xanthine dehydrogenase molybdopterin binding subunit [Phycisphaeraceae bacterium]